MSTDLIVLNGWAKNLNGVFSSQESPSSFAYSDGQASEQYLLNVLRKTKNLSSDSEELAQKIIDWPSEYHLSPERANLLKPLDFSRAKNILELGCGCGAITRYLSEQPGVQIDAIEGSNSRAELAALRCKDQSNVRVATANFNDVILPEKKYDCILLIGVTEYAGRFSEREDITAVIHLLQQAQKALNDDGVIIVAIENRLGLKYALGANEDHLAQAYVGLDDYPNNTGIRTYSQSQWRDIFTKTSLTEHQFLLPFPDYKIPQAVIKQGADTPIMDVLKNIKSRDYTKEFVIDNELRIWDAINQANMLHQLSNSYLILLSSNKANIQKISDFSWQVYPSKSWSYLTKLNQSKESVNANVEQVLPLQQRIDVLENEIVQYQRSRLLRLGRRIRKMLPYFFD